MHYLEALHDAIQHAIGWDHGSRSTINRNPGLIIGSYGQSGDIDLDGYRVYPSVVQGSKALLSELKTLFNGNNELGIYPDSTLADLCEVYFWRVPILRGFQLTDDIIEHLNAALESHYDRTTLLRELAEAKSQEEESPWQQSTRHTVTPISPPMNR